MAKDPFHIGTAAEKGHADLVDLLLEDEDIDPDSKDAEDRTPLILAAIGGHAEVVELLLDVNSTSHKWFVDVKHKAKKDVTALRAALANNHVDVTEVLLRADGIDIDREYDDKWTLLGAAAAQGHLRVAKALVKLYNKNNNKIALRKLHMNQATPLFLAAENGHEKIVKLLLANLEPEAIDDPSSPGPETTSGLTALMAAAVNGADDIVGRLLAKGANMDITNSEGRTALDEAIHSGNARVVRQFFEKTKENEKLAAQQRDKANGTGSGGGGESGPNEESAPGDGESAPGGESAPNGESLPGNGKGAPGGAKDIPGGGESAPDGESVPAGEESTGTPGGGAQ